ncbi:Snf7-domain-containing protein [Fusarium redolens]|uniref:Vacuolar-sorting protein SNF7 n=1 Tax=Fusarium redolens TaxID=48865 RepID=A0A9P9HDU4_FUSRE|nr:Snf7-domain-containing protein [Fusarium redolens]KAH7255695.1 Snf7-domain-containing protein [Fusarium redolens]
MWGWFGGAAAQKRKDTPKNAILGLRAQLDMLQKRERHLQTQIDEQDATARKNVSTNKNAAKAALRRKKTHEHALEQTVAQIGTLEQQINSIESANINKETLAAMSNANAAMKQIYGGLTVDKVDATMDELREHNAMSDEIVNAITSNSLGEPIDEDELENELDELQQEQLDEQMLKTGTVPVSDAVHKLPSVGTAEPVSSKKQAVEEDDEEAELRKLQAEMAM